MRRKNFRLFFLCLVKNVIKSVELIGKVTYFSTVYALLLFSRTFLCLYFHRNWIQKFAVAFNMITTGLSCWIELPLVVFLLLDASDNVIVNKLSHAIITHIIIHFTAMNITYLYQQIEAWKASIPKYHMSKNTRVLIFTKIH